MAESNCTLVTLLSLSFATASVQDPTQAFLLSHKYPFMIFAEENAGKVEFTLQCGVRSPSFAASAHTDKTPGAGGHELSVEAAVVCSFFPSSTVGTQGIQGPGEATQPRTAPSHCKAPQPEPCSSSVMVQAGDNTSERPQIWLLHMKVKKGRSSVSLSALSHGQK